jgi:hypothetical protein
MLKIPTAEVFEPPLNPARYKGAWRSAPRTGEGLRGERALEPCLWRYPLPN